MKILKTAPDGHVVHYSKNTGEVVDKATFITDINAHVSRVIGTGVVEYIEVADNISTVTGKTTLQTFTQGEYKDIKTSSLGSYYNDFLNEYKAILIFIDEQLLKLAKGTNTSLINEIDLSVQSAVKDENNEASPIISELATAHSLPEKYIKVSYDNSVLNGVRYRDKIVTAVSVCFKLLETRLLVNGETVDFKDQSLNIRNIITSGTNMDNPEVIVTTFKTALDSLPAIVSYH